MPSDASTPVPDGADGAKDAGPRRGRKQRSRVEPVQTTPPDDVVTPIEPVPDDRAPPARAANDRDAAEAAQPVPPAAVLLSPDEVLLQKVEPRSFRPNERNDSWLYWLTDRCSADAAMRNGMPVEPDAPLLLSDRRAVLPKLAALAEDPDWAPNAIAVLRLRRIAVEAFLRPGPEPDSYVLAGATNVSA